MAFWKDGSASPKRNFRWLVRMNQKLYWWAKTVTAPSFEVSEVEHDFLDNKYFYPGRVTWSEITLTLVDPTEPDMVNETLSMLYGMGYLVKEEPGNAKTISKSQATSTGLKGLEIAVLDAAGNEIEQWVIHNPWIKSAKYGDLDYSNDELRTVEMTIRYDWATCTFGGGQGGGGGLAPGQAGPPASAITPT